MISVGVNALVVALLGYAAWRDLATRTIPDALSIGLILLGLVARAPQGWEAVASSVVVAFGLFMAGVPLVRLGILGGADLKLLAALSVGVSPLACMDVLVFVTAAGAALAAVYMAARPVAAAASVRCGGSWLGRVAAVELWRIRRRAALPYGIAIAAGMTFFLAITPGA